MQVAETTTSPQTKPQPREEVRLSRKPGTLTSRATVPMHGRLHRGSDETGMTIQEIINDALKAAKGAD